MSRAGIFYTIFVCSLAMGIISGVMASTGKSTLASIITIVLLVLAFIFFELWLYSDGKKK